MQINLSSFVFSCKFLQSWIFPLFCLIKHREGEEKNLGIITEWLFLQTNTSISRQTKTNKMSVLEDTFYEDAPFLETHMRVTALLTGNCTGVLFVEVWSSAFRNNNLEIITDWQVQIFAGLHWCCNTQNICSLFSYSGIYFCVKTGIFDRLKIRRMLATVSWSTLEMSTAYNPSPESCMNIVGELWMVWFQGTLFFCRWSLVLEELQKTAGTMGNIFHWPSLLHFYGLL